MLTGVIFFFGVLTYLIIKRESSLIRDIYMEHSSREANLVAGHLEDFMLEDKPDSIIHYIDLINRDSDMKIGILDHNGRPAFNTRINVPLEASPEQNPLFKKIGNDLIFYKPLKNEKRCHKCHSPADGTRGMIIINHSMEKMEGEISETARRIIYFALFLGLTSEAFLIVIMRKEILNPIRILNKGAEILKTGRLDHRIDIHSDNEIGTLASCFNDMAESIERSHINLENAVKQRTKELKVIAELSTEVFKGDLSLGHIIDQFLSAITDHMGFGYSMLCLVDKDTGLLSQEFKKGTENSFCSMEISLASEHPFVKTIREARPAVRKSSDIGAPEGFTNVVIVPILSHQRKRCREINLCLQEDCPAFNSAEERCWLINGTLCRSPQAIAGKEKIYGCLHCPSFPVLGVLIAGRSEEVTKSSLHSLEILTSEIASAIENQRLIEAKREDINKLIKLHDISVESLQDLGGKLTKSIVSSVTLLSNTDATILWMKGREGTLNFKEAFNLGEELIPGSIPIDKSFIGRALIEARPVETVEMKDIKHLGEVISQNDFLYAASVPLKFKETSLGCLTLFKKRNICMSDSEKAVILLFASQAAAAINTARLYEELRISENSYRTLSENLPGIVYRIFLREDNRMQFFNNMVQQMTGFSPEELTRGAVCSLDPLIVPDDRDRIMATIDGAVSNNRPFQIEYRLRDKEGGIRYFLERGRPIRDTDGDPSYIDGVIFDITDSRQAEEDLRKVFSSLKAEKEFSDAVFNNMNMGIMVLDKEGSVIKLNPAGYGILKINSDITGKRLEQILPQASNFLIIAPDFSREIEISLWTNVITIGFNNSALLDMNEEQTGTVVVFSDLTEIKRLQTAIRKKEHFETMGKVISGVAHEVRNPLFGISSIGQILERELDSPQHKALVQAMLKETDRLKRLIEELLLYTRPSRLDIKEIDVGILLEELNHYIKAKREDVNISMNIPSFLTIKADRDKITQVLLNLLNNAIDAAKSMILISAKTSDGRIEIIIADDGAGINKEDINRIFDPFFTTKKGGTGLGLPICKKIVEDHGGSLEIESSAESGTTVTLAFKA